MILAEVKLAAGYDWTKTAMKAVKQALLTLGAVAALAVANYLADSDHIRALVGSGPAAWVLVPAITSIAAAAVNYLKHRND